MKELPLDGERGVGFNTRFRITPPDPRRSHHDGQVAQ